ncbi:hypothetical protein FQZ97_972080 [compost metagenome]
MGRPSTLVNLDAKLGAVGNFRRHRVLHRQRRTVVRGGLVTHVYADNHSREDVSDEVDGRPADNPVSVEHGDKIDVANRCVDLEHRAGTGGF